MSPLERAYRMLQETPQGTPIEEVLVGMNKDFINCRVMPDNHSTKYYNTKKGEYIVVCRAKPAFIGVPGGGRAFRMELDHNKRFIRLVEVIRASKKEIFPWEEK